LTDDATPLPLCSFSLSLSPSLVFQAREWEKSLKKEQRALERQLRHIERDEAKVKLSMKQHAKKGEVGSRLDPSHPPHVLPRRNL